VVRPKGAIVVLAWVLVAIGIHDVKMKMALQGTIRLFKAAEAAGVKVHSNTAQWASW
jgi:hypothetical protein